MSKIDKTTNEQIAKHTPGNLVVRTTSVHRQFEITRAKDGRRPPERALVTVRAAIAKAEGRALHTEGK